MRTGSGRSIVLILVTVGAILWVALPWIILKFYVPPGSTLEKIGGTEAGNVGLNFGSGDVGDFSSAPPSPPPAPSYFSQPGIKGA
jgi:hypothetical protein